MRAMGAVYALAAHFRARQDHLRGRLDREDADWRRDRRLIELPRLTRRRRDR